jgi:hypothetical protein
MPGPVNADGSLTVPAVALLHAVSGVPEDLLRKSRIRPASRNWLHAPWYPYRRGGAITLGRTIWFTRIWFDPKGLGDGSPQSCWQWLLILAHEVGHLPQVERFGHGLIGKVRYVLTFAWQYAMRAMLFRHPVHDGSPLELEADLGRQVLLKLAGPAGMDHVLVAAIQAGDAHAVRHWCADREVQLAQLKEAHQTVLRT